jgi:hypothetical protein
MFIRCSNCDIVPNDQYSRLIQWILMVILKDHQYILHDDIVPNDQHSRLILWILMVILKDHQCILHDTSYPNNMHHDHKDEHFLFNRKSEHFPFDRKSSQKVIVNGRPSTSRTEEMIGKVRQLIRCDWRMTLAELEQEVGISHGPIHTILSDDLKMRHAISLTSDYLLLYICLDSE